MKASFPHVTCDLHRDEPRPGWVVCVHVLDSRVAIAHLATPSKDELGQMLCARCFVVSHILDSARLICGDCVGDLLRSRESNS